MTIFFQTFVTLYWTITLLFKSLIILYTVTLILLLPPLRASCGSLLPLRSSSHSVVCQVRPPTEGSSLPLFTLKWLWYLLCLKCPSSIFSVNPVSTVCRGPTELHYNRAFPELRMGVISPSQPLDYLLLRLLSWYWLFTSLYSWLSLPVRTPLLTSI